MDTEAKKQAVKFMGGTLEEWKNDTGASWTEFLGTWKPEEVAELERRIKAIPFPKSGYWDTILTYPKDMVEAVFADPNADEMRDQMMRCVLEYRMEIQR